MPELSGLAIEQVTHEQVQKRPYCGYRSNTLYRLESWDDQEASCAGCFLSLLMDGNYTIHDRTDQATN